MARLYTTLLFFLCFFALKAQTHKEPNPLQQFFKNNYDSTIIYYPWSNWDSAPNYYIVAKKGRDVYCFTYSCPPYKRMAGRYYPGNLNLKFMQLYNKFKAISPDTNNYFAAYTANYNSQKSLWKQINSFGIWNLKDKDLPNNTCVTDDGGYDTYYLITNTGVRAMEYYGVETNKECAPKDINRQKNIQIRECVKTLFQNSH
jgi:hypothetical protein